MNYFNNYMLLMKGACQAAVRALRRWHCNALYNTLGGLSCMGELTVQGTQCGQRLAGQSQCDILSVGLLKPLFLSVVIIGEDHRALLESMFLIFPQFLDRFFSNQLLFPIIK